MKYSATARGTRAWEKRGGGRKDIGLTQNGEEIGPWAREVLMGILSCAVSVKALEWNGCRLPNKTRLYLI